MKHSNVHGIPISHEFTYGTAQALVVRCYDSSIKGGVAFSLRIMGGIDDVTH